MRAIRFITLYLAVSVVFGPLELTHASEDPPCGSWFNRLGEWIFGDKTVRSTPLSVEGHRIFWNPVIFAKGGAREGFQPEELNQIWGFGSASPLRFVRPSSDVVGGVSKDMYHRALARGEVIVVGRHDYADHAPGFARLSETPIWPKITKYMTRAFEIYDDPNFSKSDRTKARGFAHEIADTLEIFTTEITAADIRLWWAFRKYQEAGNSAYDEVTRALAERAHIEEKIAKRIEDLEKRRDFQSLFAGAYWRK